MEVILRTSYFVAGFMTFWLGTAVLFNAVAFNAEAMNGHLGDLALALVFPVFGFAVVAFGRLLARGERRTLLDFIRQTTGAQDFDPGLKPTG